MEQATAKWKGYGVTVALGVAAASTFLAIAVVHEGWEIPMPVLALVPVAALVLLAVLAPCRWLAVTLTALIFLAIGFPSFLDPAASFSVMMFEILGVFATLGVAGVNTIAQYRRARRRAAAEAH